MKISIERLFVEMANEDIRSLPYSLQKHRRKEMRKKLITEYKKNYLASLGFRLWAHAVVEGNFERAEEIKILFQRFRFEE